MVRARPNCQAHCLCACVEPTHWDIVSRLMLFSERDKSPLFDLCKGTWAMLAARSSDCVCSPTSLQSSDLAFHCTGHAHKRARRVVRGDMASLSPWSCAHTHLFQAFTVMRAPLLGCNWPTALRTCACNWPSILLLFPLSRSKVGEERRCHCSANPGMIRFLIWAVLILCSTTIYWSDIDYSF